MALPGGYLGPAGAHGPDTILGLAHSRAAEFEAGHNRLPDPDRRGGGGCRRPLVILGRIIIAFILLGWTLTIITSLGGG